MDFPNVLPRLVAAYESGRLVPFIGSGMSRPACTDWLQFVYGLEMQASTPDAPAAAKAPARDTPRDELIRRANTAVRSLKSREPGAFEQALAAALVTGEGGPPAIPPQTEALASIWWPLVLSTNYDNCYAAAFRKHFPDRHVATLGRSSEDCQRVLNSLSVAGRSLLWALQGYLDGVPFPLDPPANAEPSQEFQALRAELVVGHAEYRRVTYRDLHFRRAFAEVFRQRTLLFLGAGIKETYVQELFGEVLELYGPSTRAHYAFVAEDDELDAEFMLARFQIIVVPYREHGEVRERLEALAGQVKRPRRTAVAWQWGRIDPRGESDWSSQPDLELVRGPLPERRADGECLAVSAGGRESRFYFSRGIRSVMGGWGVDAEDRPTLVNPYLGVFEGRPVYAVRARSPGADRRSLSDIYDAALAFFGHIAGSYRCIRMQLLATGGADKRSVPAREWDVRDYPERFSLIQMVRAWAAWRETNPVADCRLAIHVVQDTVYQDIASGRIDVLELLTCRDIRFFAEIVSAQGDVERRLFQEMPDRTLASIVEELQLSPQHWTIEVTPRAVPRLLDDPDDPASPVPAEPPGRRPLAQRLDLTLLALGVIPGSTLHFHRL